MDYLQYYKLGSDDTLAKKVLNLVINGLPSIHETLEECKKDLGIKVLNLVINGLPSIQEKGYRWYDTRYQSFKPCYKWITFNTPVAGSDGALTLKF